MHIQENIINLDKEINRQTNKANIIIYSNMTNAKKKKKKIIAGYLDKILIF